MKKLIPILFILFAVSNGYSDSTQINSNLSEPPPAGTKQIVIGSGLYAASTVGLIAAIYFYEESIKPNRPKSCTYSPEEFIMESAFVSIACAVTGTIIIHRGIKKRRIYLEWKLGHN
jgi:hypothetical protein